MKRLFTFFSLLACTFSLFSQQWVRQHPFAGFAPLHAITFDTNGDGWAVGEQSLILHTENWGELWRVQGGIADGNVLESVEIVPGTNAQTVLIGGFGIFMSEDGGETWDDVYTPEFLDRVGRIQAFDEMNWVASGVSWGARTTNGGLSWEVFAMPDNSARGTWFNDLNNGWAGAGPFNANQIYKTTNGGDTWELADDDLYPIVTDIAMLDNQTGFMSARDFVYKTTDGGASWNKLHDDVQPSLTHMHVVNENIICSGLNNGFIFYTTTGGTDWEQINPNLINSNLIQDVFATTNGRIWAPGKYASIQYSMDNGQIWEDQTPGTKSTLLDVAFDGEVGFAVGSEGAFLRTTNGGAFWENIGFDDQTAYTAVFVYVDGGTRYVYLATSSGTIYRSINDGETWDDISQGLGQIRCLYVRNTLQIGIGTETDIQYTTNGGQNWTPAIQTANLVSEISFGSPTIGYAAVFDGRILKTFNAGQSWAPVLERTGYRFSGVHFNDDMQGWAVAEIKDSVWTTQNGGMSWTSYKLPANTFWQDVHFMDADIGYISGGGAGDGRILRTENGGQTWVQSFDESERLNKMYVRPGEDFVWVVGFGGNILHFSPCALAPEISNLTGDVNPCEGDIAVYEVNSSGATVFTWTVPAGWTIIGNDNSARIEVLVGSGSGQITIQAANTCGTQTTQLTVDVSSIVGGNVSITEISGTLRTTLSGVTYQWLGDDIEIPGATNSSFTPTVSGTYTLVVTFPNGCTATSNAIFVMISGVRDLRKAELFLYPNPVQNLLTLQIDAVLAEDIRVFDVNGKNVLNASQMTTLDLSALGAGTYLITVNTAKAVYLNHFVKVR